MASPRRTEPRETKVDAQPERLTALERAIDRSDIDVAACIKALGGFIFKAALGIAIVIGAFSGRPFGLPSSVGAVFNAAVSEAIPYKTAKP